MKLTLLWIVTAIFIIVYLAIQCFIRYYLDLGFEIEILAIEILANILLLGLSGLIFGWLVTYISKHKFKFTFPVFTLLIALVGIYAFSKKAYRLKTKGIVIGSSMLYAQVQPLSPGGCAVLHDGKFETGSLLIERFGDIQTQTDKHTNEKKEYKIRWLSNCEYRLDPITPSAGTVEVKIVGWNDIGYHCYVSTGKLAYKMVLWKVKE